MELKPKADKPSKFEFLVCEIIEKGWDVTVQDEGTAINIWLGDWSLTLHSNGKWTLN